MKYLKKFEIPGFLKKHIWELSPQASPWTPTPMSPPRRRKKRHKQWEMYSPYDLSAQK